MVEKLLRGNEEFQKIVHCNRAAFEKLYEKQTPLAVWVGCADSRAQPNVVTSAGSGTIFPFASVANAVPKNLEVAGATLEYGFLGLANPGGKPPALVVCGHYDCGGIRELVERHHPDFVKLHAFLKKNVGPARKILDKALKEKGEALEGSDYLDALAEANTLFQFERVKSFWAVKKAGPEAHAWMLDLKTGKIRTEMTELKRRGLLERVRELAEAAAAGGRR
ncbi:MAG: carbonic anhydrase [Candidatus Micrarchaeota archaeon]|nr:carbonic anhydrase [Candidatus Micrarchaeota archaeon]